VPDAHDLIDRWFEDLFNGTDPSAAGEILAENAEYHGPASLTPQHATGPDEIREYVETFRNAFPGVRYAVEDVFRSADGDRYCARWSALGSRDAGTFDAEGGETFTDVGINVFEIRDGRITEIRSEWDTLRMVQELNIVSPLGDR